MDMVLKKNINAERNDEYRTLVTINELCTVDFMVSYNSVFASSNNNYKER